MPKDPNSWVEQTASIYQTLNDHAEARSPIGRRRIRTYLNLVVNDRIHQVGAEQGLEELQQVIHIVHGDKY